MCGFSFFFLFNCFIVTNFISFYLIQAIRGVSSDQLPNFKSKYELTIILVLEPINFLYNDSNTMIVP